MLYNYSFPYIHFLFFQYFASTPLSSHLQFKYPLFQVICFPLPP